MNVKTASRSNGLSSLNPIRFRLCHPLVLLVSYGLVILKLQKKCAQILCVFFLENSVCARCAHTNVESATVGTRIPGNFNVGSVLSAGACLKLWRHLKLLLSRIIASTHGPIY